MNDPHKDLWEHAGAAEKAREGALREVFLKSVEIEDVSARVAFLDRACAGDQALRRRVLELLAADEGATGAGREGANSGTTTGERPGHRVGRYKLLQQVGEGGCGVVFMAEQEEPVRRRVALKVIKLGMDTRQVVARFEAERQALALMDHPSIARVLDAGATESGRPFFVMELVRGMKITDYCEQHQRATRRRLDLFIQVCQAVQHAHQKGIIHRDLKPSNILVTELDGEPVPKVIDFGIAKAVEGRLTDQTLFTAFEQFLGTPAYMSPEQAAITAADIDTRSDIYSLGVLLYELLTGKTPFDTKALLASGLDEMRRTIREREPARPSTRLTQEHSAKSDVRSPKSEIDRASSRRLLQEIRGDLDWIVMKCLEKDRRRRYETANALAMDLKRHLENQPVLARPPSRLYEFQKTVRRHKLGFAAAAAVILALAGGVAVSAWQAIRARKAEREQSRLRADAEVALEVSRQSVSNMLQRLKDPAGAVAVLGRAVQRWPDQPQLWSVKGLLAEHSGRVEEAIEDFTRAIELIEARADTTRADIHDALLTRSRLLRSLGRLTDAGRDLCRVNGIPLRDTQAPPTSIDLSLFYTGPLTESLHLAKGRPGNDLAAVPQGLLTFAGVRFDVRGVISVSGRIIKQTIEQANLPFELPVAVTNIPIGLKFARLYCFTGTGWHENEGVQIGTLALHYVNGHTDDLPIRYGIHVRDCIARPALRDNDQPLEHGRVVWTGMNDHARELKGHLRLYLAAWDNPHRDEVVRSVDFVSTMSDSAPFLIAMTVEP